jgi:hypothetical protein
MHNAAADVRCRGKPYLCHALCCRGSKAGHADADIILLDPTLTRAVQAKHDRYTHKEALVKWTDFHGESINLVPADEPLHYVT